ncbi:MAG: DUF488 domain-containing protein [Dehalococcoidia bacterium]
MTLTLKRVYEPAGDDDGERLLVDRLWPRGVSKAEAKLTDWLKDLAPSTELRRWFGHEPSRWAEFHQRYSAELGRPKAQAIVQMLADKARQGPVTLVYAARDTEHNEAVVLQQLIEGDHPLPNAGGG